jgi:hypothetical protein
MFATDHPPAGVAWLTPAGGRPIRLQAAATAAEQEQHEQDDDDDQEQRTEPHLASLRVGGGLPVWSAG